MAKRKATTIIKNVNEEAFQKAVGEIPYSLTNDYMFRAVLQENEEVLRGLICSLLNITNDDIKTIDITNPIVLGETIDNKSVILDLAILFNNDQRMNIEMQVVSQDDWPERSLYYLCKDFCQLLRGQNYGDILPLLHINILDFILFEEHPMFYSQYRLMEMTTNHVYSGKIGINVLELKSIKLATNEDKACKLDYWAKIFKATTWEEIKMLAQNDEAAHQAALSMYTLTGDEKIRKQCEARERYEMDKRSLYTQGLKQGLEQGFEQSLERTIETALNDGRSCTDIAQFLHISVEEVEAIKQKSIQR
ncbi:MAG: Rpn family recombination-promoting nuclease/putative transposase [bacterium]|nr:Rpn family recombination-promoting nuclease/putative transposase [bacterium]